MRALVAIANFGTKNRRFLDRLLREYRSMDLDTDVVVLSDRPKELGDDAEVRVGLPDGDPWTLPFAHKSLFEERKNDYDLYIYSEDDTLLTERSIEAFLRITEVLPEDRIAGFLRYEQDPHGNRFCTSVHSHFHWVPGSTERFGDYTTAYFTNEHAACFILTRDQLRRAIDSGGFLTGPHQGAYDLACTAATDPYTRCGMRKVIPVSHLEDFMLHHLPDRYHQRIGIGMGELHRQIEALGKIDGMQRNRKALFPSVKEFWRPSFNKSYYEKPDQDLLDSIPQGVESILSVGCGWGELENRLISDGARVVGIPVDGVIAESARMRGLEVVEPDFNAGLAALSGRHFDCVVLSNILQHVEHPEQWLRALREIVCPGAVVVGTVPNLKRHGTKKRMGISPKKIADPYRKFKMHLPSRGTVRQWLTESGWRVDYLGYGTTEESSAPRQIAGNVVPELVARSILFRGLQ